MTVMQDSGASAQGTRIIIIDLPPDLDGKAAVEAAMVAAGSRQGPQVGQESSGNLGQPQGSGGDGTWEEDLDYDMEPASGPEPEEAEDWESLYWDSDDTEPEQEKSAPRYEEDIAGLAWDNSEMARIGAAETCRRIARALGEEYFREDLQGSGYVGLEDLLEFGSDKTRGMMANIMVQAARKAFPKGSRTAGRGWVPPAVPGMA